MTGERAKLFEEVQEPDLSRFTPRTDPVPAPAIEQVRRRLGGGWISEPRSRSA